MATCFICRGSAPGWSGRSVGHRELPHTAMAAAPCNLPGMWVPTSAWHLGPFAVPVPTVVWPCLLGFSSHPADAGHRGASSVSAPAVPVSSFVRNLSQPHALVLLGALLLRVHVLCTRLLCQRVSQSGAHLLIFLSDLKGRELVTLVRLDAFVCSFLYFLPHLLRGFPSGTAVKNPPAVQESQET